MMHQLALEISPPPQPGFGNFVAGRNGELLSVLSALAQGAGAERFIYMWGVPGCGKTHLLRALHSALFDRGVEALFLAGPGARPDVSPARVVLADDVERFGDDAQEQLFNVYNAVRDSGGMLVAAGAVPSARLPLRRDLVTRLGWGLVYQVHTLSDEEKMAALVAHSQARGFDLPPEVLSFLLRRYVRDLSALVALIDALDRYSLEAKRAITVPLVKELLAGSEP